MDVLFDKRKNLVGKGKLHNLIYGSDTAEVISEADLPVYVARSV